MNAGVTVWRCTGCGRRCFPEPLLCPACHGHEFAMDSVSDGLVEEVSVIRHMLGQENWQPRRIANVRAAGGVLMTVGLRDESGPGMHVTLFQEGEAPFGRAKG